MPKPTRQDIIDTLARGLEPISFIQAAWVSGSEATGRSDEWSDIDLQVVSDDGLVEDAFDAVRETLAALSPVAHIYVPPRPTWHGHPQEYYTLRDANDWHMMDVCVIEASDTKERFLEPLRHGEALVLFDKSGQARAETLDREAHLAKMRDRLPKLRERFWVFQNVVSKAVWRGATADAQESYLTLTYRPLVELLRMRHCPIRYDYGLRYLDRDLPGDVEAEVQALALPGTTDEIETFRQRAAEMFAMNERAYDAGEWKITLDDQTLAG